MFINKGFLLLAQTSSKVELYIGARITWESERKVLREICRWAESSSRGPIVVLGPVDNRACSFCCFLIQECKRGGFDEGRSFGPFR